MRIVACGQPGRYGQLEENGVRLLNNVVATWVPTSITAKITRIPKKTGQMRREDEVRVNLWTSNSLK